MFDAPLALVKGDGTRSDLRESLPISDLPMKGKPQTKRTYEKAIKEEERDPARRRRRGALLRTCAIRHADRVPSRLDSHPSGPGELGNDVA